MDRKQFDEYITDLAHQAAVSYAKIANLDESDFARLKKTVRQEMELGFAHLLVTE